MNEDLPIDNDKETITAIQNGNDKAFDALVKQYLPLTYRYLFRLTGSKTTAEDLSQETFVRVWKSLKRFDTTKLFRPWLYCVARNCAYDYLRKKKIVSFSFLSVGEQFQLENTPDKNTSPLELFEKKETASAVKKLLAQLSDTEKEILTLHYLEELTVPEIAEILNKPEETIRTRLRRARQAFREAKMQNEPASSPSNVLIGNDHRPGRTQKSSPLTPETTTPERA